jgi:molybdopterin synthase catalytic subunit
VAQTALARWPLLGLTAIHRFGMIAPGEDIVLVIAASAHRRAAFEAADFMMDYLKTRAPFWKREHLIDGTTGAWVESKAEDDAAAARW